MTAQQRAAHDDNERLARMENSISTVGEQLGSLIRITEKNDADRRAEIRDLWNGLKEQGHLHAISLEKQGEKFAAVQGRGELTWGKLVAAGGFMLSLATAAVVVSNAFVARGFEQVAIHDKYALVDRQDIRAELVAAEGRLGRESQLRNDQQQVALDRYRMELDAIQAHIVAGAKLEGEREAEFLWLRDDAKAIKEDLHNHIEATRAATP